MKIYAGSNYWRMLCFILMAGFYIQYHYFSQVTAQKIQQRIMDEFEPIWSGYFWFDLAEQVPTYQAIFTQGLRLNLVNDELYIRDLIQLSSIIDQSNQELSLAALFSKHIQYPDINHDDIQGFCLKLRFVQAYHDKIISQSYNSPSLTRYREINQRAFNEIQPWLKELPQLKEQCESKS